MSLRSLKIDSASWSYSKSHSTSYTRMKLETNLQERIDPFNLLQSNHKSNLTTWSLALSTKRKI